MSYLVFLTNENTQKDGVWTIIIFLRTGFLVHNATYNMAQGKIMQFQQKKDFDLK